jgi:flagellar basal-body rod protein FlgC
MSNLLNALTIAASGMKAQGTRMRVVAENIANSESTSQTPGGEPYRRKVLTFKEMLDKSIGAQLVHVNKVMPDASDFTLKYDPSHPAANSDGYVLTPNVNPLIEMADMREAERSYEANLNVIQSTKSMLSHTLSLLGPGN